MNRQRLSLWWFVGTLVFALLSMLVPLPGVLEPFKPYWPALVLLYWSLESEDRVTLGLAFAVGLAADLLNGVVLGEQALRLCALAFIALRFRSRLRFFPMWQQALAVLALLLNDRILLLIVRVLAGASLPPASWWISPFVGAALWPFLFLLLDDLRARLRIQ
ncbi:MAG: rod shape-determining protein MreD [Rhodanobacter sp.]|jgi:rod shape-determining protein MreD|uniref:rod shape-determining protein MreD n=1 Tax=Rhodanobacter sp. KK11 TaxID=3083255 RepID=UPI002966170C|nr:rod shape-determining protein MreD [Rhodanobacter sp. KK11]MDW2982872.1 rod shape-determining protein MreD [Rhodanobacter sp. KK11]